MEPPAGASAGDNKCDETWCVRKEGGGAKRLSDHAVEAPGTIGSGNAIIRNDGFTSFTISNFRKATGPVAKKVLLRLHVSRGHPARIQMGKSLARRVVGINR